jgi:hypothetical protein
VCFDSTGAWGAVCLLRESGRPRFEASEVGFLASLAPVLAEGLRRAAILGDVATADQRVTGVVVLGPDNSDLAAGDPAGWKLPVAVLPWQHGRGASPAISRMIPTRTNLGPTRWPGPEFIPRIGNWVTVRGSVLGEGPGSSVAVLIEEAQPPELAPLIADGYGLNRPQTTHHRTRRPGPSHQRRRAATAPLRVHRPRPPQGDLRQDRRQLAR